MLANIASIVTLCRHRPVRVTKTPFTMLVSQRSYRQLFLHWHSLYRCSFGFCRHISTSTDSLLLVMAISEYHQFQLRIMRLSVSDHKATKRHLIPPDHKTSIRYLTPDSKVNVRHIHRVGYQEHFTSTNHNSLSKYTYL